MIRLSLYLDEGNYTIGNDMSVYVNVVIADDIRDGSYTQTRGSLPCHQRRARVTSSTALSLELQSISWRVGPY